MPSQTLRAACPSCRNPLRLPAEWVGQVMRCKKCGSGVQARPKAAAPAPVPVAAPVPAAPAAPYYAPPAAYPQPVAPPTSQSLPGTDAYTPAFLPSANGQGSYRARKRGASGGKKLVLGFVALLLAGGLAAGGLYFAKPELFGQAAEGDGGTVKNTEGTGGGDGPPEGTAPSLPAAKGPMPRRMLAIGVNNYLYANPTHSGIMPRGSSFSVSALAERFMTRWRLPKDQVYVLCDGTAGAKDSLPLKPIVEQAIQKFCETSRPQDRVLLMFAGQATEIDGEPFLAPLEADLADKKTLIPLKWVYDQLAACKAQQKLFLIDVCRYDPGRGSERPGSEPMGEKLDAMLAGPPPGVVVWSSCVAGQQSFEVDYANDERRSYELAGSVFLSGFFYAAHKGTMSPKGIQQESDPLPVGPLAEAVNEFTTDVVGRKQKAKQTPRLSGKDPAGQVAYDPTEPVPARFEIPTPASLLGAGVADRKLIKAITAEIDVPPIKIARKGTTPTSLDAIFPFPADVMKDYQDDVPAAEVAANPDKFPLRVATVDAIKLLRKIRESTDMNQSSLPEEFRGETDERAKAAILAQQRFPAEVQLLLEEELQKMDAASEKRDTEQSKRWLANFDFATAQLKARYAYIHEYNLMLGKVRKGELPPLDASAGHKGWRLASVSKMTSAKEVREIEAESRKLLAKLIKEHAGTPYEVLARRERYTSLGLQWQATAFGGE